MSERGALDGVVVVDLTSEIGGAYAGKLLADLGADVVLVEPPDGSPLRRRPPVRGGATDGLWFEHLSGSKRSLVPPEGPGGAALLRELLGEADVLLRDGTSPHEPRLPTVRPGHLVEVDLSPFGRSGPYAGWRRSDLALWALGGYLAITGSPERQPLWLRGSQAELHAGANAAFAALVALYERHRHGWGQAVEVSALESVLTAHAWLASSWAACGQPLTRVGNDLIRASDGWVYVMRIAPNDELFVLIDRPDLAAENLTDDVITWFASIPRIFEAVAAWAEDQTVDHIVDLGQALRVAVTPVLDAAGVRADPQLAARNWWERDDDGGPVFPGQPYHLSASHSRRRGPAPVLGRDTGPLRSGSDRRAPVGAAPLAPPLEGLRVLEVTANWAGPVAGRFLADLGADVVKVERAAKPATRALFWVGPDQDQQRQGHHRAMYFNEMNRGKRDVCLDLSRPDGREVFLRLVERADVLIENNSARVMGNLELDWPALQRVNRRLIMVSMSGYGADGPRRDWLAYGSNIETTSGLTSLTGYPDGELSRTGLFYADPVSGIHGAVAIMAALEHRRRTGQGQWVELALNECGVAFCAEALLTLAATGEVPGPAANRDPRFAPHGVYPCAGVDKWVAIAVQTDDEWPLLAGLAGRPDLAADPQLASLEGRLRRHDELDVAVAAWTATLEQYEVAWACQRAGVSAAPVLANWQVLPDPHLHHRGFFQPQEHPVVGVYPMPTWPWRLSRTPARFSRPAPLFAEHNWQILAEAGLDRAAIEALYASGATADEPE